MEHIKEVDFSKPAKDKFWRLDFSILQWFLMPLFELGDLQWNNLPQIEINFLPIKLWAAGHGNTPFRSSLRLARVLQLFQLTHKGPPLH